jgi:SPP1 gp7 family putative phage head morphogenesis protein
MPRRKRFDAGGEKRKLDAIERRLVRRLRAINTRFYLWVLEYAKTGIPPQAAPHWLSKLTATALRECHREAFALGWEGADKELRRVKPKRPVHYAIRERDVKSRRAPHGRVEGNWMTISMPSPGAHPAMTSFLVGGVLMADGSYSFPYPQEGLRWYSDQALRLAATSDEAKLGAVRDVIKAGVDEGATHRQMAGYVAEALKPFGLQGGLGAEQAVPGATGALRGVTDLPQWQVDRIVRTETTQIYNAGRYLRQVGEDIITGWEWSSVLDDVCCDECEERDGIFIPKGEEIGEMPPLHPSCRCICLEVLDFEQEPDKSLEDLPESAAMPDGWGDPLRREWAE